MAPVCDFCGLSGSLGSELAPLGGGGLAFLLELYISPFSWQVLFMFFIFFVDVL